MNKILILLLNIVSVLLILPAAATENPDSRFTAENGSHLAHQPVLVDMETRISPVQQEYGVGVLHTVTMHPPECSIQSEPLEARISNLIGGQYFAWIIWDMTVIPQDAEIIGIQIEYTLYPDPTNSPGTWIQYRSLESTYLPPPECWTANYELFASSIYLEVEMGASSGVRLHELGGDAVPDAAGAVATQDYFSLWILCIGTPGSAMFPGWSEGGPELIVSWRAGVAVKSSSWGAIKALMR